MGNLPYDDSTRTTEASDTQSLSVLWIVIRWARCLLTCLPVLLTSDGSPTPQHLRARLSRSWMGYDEGAMISGRMVKRRATWRSWCNVLAARQDVRAPAPVDVNIGTSRNGMYLPPILGTFRYTYIHTPIHIHYILAS